jgi:hypothetical protein
MHGAWKQPAETRDIQADPFSDSCAFSGTSILLDKAEQWATGPLEPRLANGDAARRVRPEAAVLRDMARHMARNIGGADSCLSDEQVLAFVEGRLGQHDLTRIDNHLSSCPACSALVMEAVHACGLDHDSPASLSSRYWTFEPGTCLAGRYVIRRCLGQGGMGEVYAAFDAALGQDVALKTARATECDDPGVHRRLSLEVKLARLVCHTNVCRVHDVGIHREAGPNSAEFGFISMELIEGESLAQRLRREPLTLDHFAVIGRELLMGVSAIHRAGVIHRDIKSHNVMLRHPAGAPIAIIDFGLAIEQCQGIEERSDRCGHAGRHSFDGSPAYMAPEQFRGARVTAATDVFAVGVVLFQALTCQLPFLAFQPDRRAGARRDPAEVPLRARSLAPHVPARMDAFIARCLELDPERRFSSAPSALEAFEFALGSSPCAERCRE